MKNLTIPEGVSQKHIFIDLCRFIPKEGLPDRAAANSFFGLISTIQYNSVYDQCHTKRRIWRGPTIPSFGITTTKIFKDMFLQHMPHLYCGTTQFVN